MREANVRRRVAGELAAMRIPDVGQRLASEALTFTPRRRGGRRHVSIVESTRDQHHIQLAKLVPIVGKRGIDTLTADDFIDVVAQLNGDGVAR